MQGGDQSKQKFVWMGLIVLAFIAGAVATMAGLRTVQVPPNAANQAHPAAGQAAHGGGH